ncbi:hypothetical protein [Pararhodobacter zhoushanensis]|uniref:hypothetical protein n=1 Tax=Pararhodobacter zhoushanensis TaxID=2479545 RepID=UPI000F8DC0C7|nr:hypothetical protein [Pararhodobacter zhoushanensis]
MIRSWSDIEALDPPLTAPERQLIEACKAGVECVLGDGTRPEGADPARTIRADLLRYLILGGCADCLVHEWGVLLAGAWISGELDLSFATAKGQTLLIRCGFEKPVLALQTAFEVLNLTGSALKGLNAQGARVTGDVFLRDGFEAEGTVSFSGAVIGGQLDCSGSKFCNPEGDAFSAQGAQVTGDVFLRDGFEAEGAVSLLGAVIGGQLECSGSKFRNPEGKALQAQNARVTGGAFLCDGFEAEGEVRLSGAVIGGQLVCRGGKFRNPEGIALNAHSVQVSGAVFLSDGFGAEGGVYLLGAAIGGQLSCNGSKFRNAKGSAFDGQRMAVNEGFYWREVAVDKGSVNLASARVGDLVDDLKSWPSGENRLYLDGFIYERISASFIDAERRLKWLSRGTIWKGEFHPQPYSHLAKVLREMGHERAAKDVMVEQRKLIAFHIRKRARIAPNGDWDVAFRGLGVDLLNAWRWFWDFAVRAVAGYGFKPARSVIVLAVLFVVAVFVANRAWNEGSMVPNSDVILVSEGWRAVAEQRDASALWTDTGAPGQDWETFNRYAWGFDVVVPILSLGQAEAWAPSTERGPWGVTAWWSRWVLSTLGWGVVALAAAAVTGMIRREGE